MSREPDQGQGIRRKFPVPEHCHGGQHIRDCRRDRGDWLEAVSCLYWMDRGRGEFSCLDRPQFLVTDRFDQMVVIFFFFVETAGKTLEELSEIFNAKNPVKKSLEKTRVTVDESGRVMSIGEGHGSA